MDSRRRCERLWYFGGISEIITLQLWEPTIRHLFSSSAGAVIDEIWAWESVQHGDACMINHDALSGLGES